MKDKLLILIIGLFMIRCNSQVNTSDPQISRTIKDSKANGVFIKQYIIESSTDNNIILEEAWSERTWFYEIHNGKKVKAEKHGCQFCFRLKQTSNLKYSLNNLNNWLMAYPKTDLYVGIAYGIYEVSFANCDIPNVITLDLIERKDTNSTITRTKVGVLNFKTIN